MTHPTPTEQRHLRMLETALGNLLIQYLKTDHIIEIMINPDGKIWIDSLEIGKQDTKQKMSADERLNIIKLIASYHQLSITHDRPELACELPFYSARFQAWTYPVTSEAVFVIRKRPKYVYPIEHYVNQGSLSHADANKIKSAIKNRFNILIAGGTGSGKTTFANAILHELTQLNERIFILEDVPELQITSPDVVLLRKSENITMQQLVKSCLRMRPDRIIMGEVRDGSALDLLKAWNTGHPGGICTIHANSAESVMARLENLVLEALPKIPRNLIDEAVDIIIFMQKNGYRDYLVSDLKVVSTRARKYWSKL